MTTWGISHHQFLELFKLNPLEPCQGRMRGLGTELSESSGRVVARWLYCPKCKIAYRIAGEKIVARHPFQPRRKEPPF